MKHLEIWEAMELLDLTPRMVKKQLSVQFRRSLDADQIKAARIKYWCHKAKIKDLAAEYEVSVDTMSDCIKRRDAYKSV